MTLLAKNMTCELQAWMPAGGGVWADTAKEQSAIVRASLETQVAAKMDAKTVDSSSLDWSAAEESTDLHGSACIDEDAPRLSSETSVLNACMGKQGFYAIRSFVHQISLLWHLQAFCNNSVLHKHKYYILQCKIAFICVCVNEQTSL